MTTTICNLSVDWNGCPYCSMLKGCVESAESTVRAASERLDQAYADYRSEREAGRAEIGTGQWRVWQDRLRYLEQQLTAAHDTWGNAIDEWADCIHTHRRRYEEQQREAGAEPDRTDVLPETEGMSPVPEPDMFTLPPVATLHVASCNQALRDWIMRLDHDTTPSDSPDHLTDAEREETATLPETEEMSAVPAAKIAHSHNLTASTAECPLCSMLDRDRIDARAALAARAQNLHMLTDKYIHQLENGTLGYDGLGEWTDRLLEAGDDWSSHQSAVTNAEWRYRNAITVHSDLAAARRCETEEMEEVPTPNPLIRADKLMGILDREEAAYKVTIGFCDLWDLDASDLHARLATIQAIRTQLERLIDEAKENTNA